MSNDLSRGNTLLYAYLLASHIDCLLGTLESSRNSLWGWDMVHQFSINLQVWVDSNHPVSWERNPLFGWKSDLNEVRQEDRITLLCSLCFPLAFSGDNLFCRSLSWWDRERSNEVYRDADHTDTLNKHISQDRDGWNWNSWVFWMFSWDHHPIQNFWMAQLSKNCSFFWQPLRILIAQIWHRRCRRRISRLGAGRGLICHLIFPSIFSGEQAYWISWNPGRLTLVLRYTFSE